MTNKQVNPLGNKTIIYQLDADDRLIHVNIEWDRFANDNTGDSLLSHKIVNQSIWDYITGPEVQVIYKELFKRARASKKTIAFNYRCDSAEMKRYMHMSIVPYQNSDGLQLYSRELRQEPQRKVVKLDFLGDHEIHVNSQLRCSNCNKINVGNEWLELEDAVEKAGIFQKQGTFKVMSTVCGECHARLMQLGIPENLSVAKP